MSRNIKVTEGVSGWENREVYKSDDVKALYRFPNTYSLQIRTIHNKEMFTISNGCKEIQIPLFSVERILKRYEQCKRIYDSVVEDD